MTPRILVAYATTDGQTAKIAADVAKTLRDRAVAVTLVNVAEDRMADPAPYSAVIVAASVHVGRFQKSVRDWARIHRQTLASRPAAFIGVCLAVANRSPSVDRGIQAVLDRFVLDTGWKPAETKVVAGALKYTKYGWLKRWVLKRIAAKQGGGIDTTRDYEYTDWDDLRAFATRFAAELPTAEGSSERGAAVGAAV